MKMQDTVNRAEQNIRQAMADYMRHTYQTTVVEDVSDDFITRLASDSSYAKQDLRRLFSQSPAWHEDIDAIIINGTRTHDPDYSRARSLAEEILWIPMHDSKEKLADIDQAIDFFTAPAIVSGKDDFRKALSIDAINRLAPKAYAEGKKPSRIFRAICKSLGVVDESAGSEFQRLYAQFADELTSKKIGFKLYVSINPAHFLTMSNPKGDDRGNTLTSCHSFNSTDYEYNNGCSGYARDSTSFIVFTVADPAIPETLNNRKTTRQVFAYRPGSGLLMQSRMYNTSGGVYGASADSKLYRDLVQREISSLERTPNLWRTKSACGEWAGLVETGEGFGGYADWTYSNFDGHISVRIDCDPETVEPLEVGTYGLCVVCGCENSSGMYCEDCDHGNCVCDECGEYCVDTTEVYNNEGDTVYVCDDCLDRYYSQCYHCDEWHHNDDVTEIDGHCYCNRCRDEVASQCEDCEEWHLDENMTWVVDGNGNEIRVCEDCLNEYFYCEQCGNYHPDDEMNTVYLRNGNTRDVCDSCLEEYEECPECGEMVFVREDGTCPHCGVIIKEVKVED